MTELKVHCQEREGYRVVVVFLVLNSVINHIQHHNLSLQGR